MAVKQYEPDLEVIVVEVEEEPLEAHVFEHPLLDGDELAEYQHSPDTAGVQYSAPGVDVAVEPEPLVDGQVAEQAPEPKSVKSSKKSE